MRTTVTLDPDVERLLKEKSRKTRQSFKQVLNNAIRQGLREEALLKRKLFQVKARPMRLRAGIDPARLSEIGDDLEVEAFLNTTNRLTGKLSS
jgi:predicted transcriptional regulator